MVRGGGSLRGGVVGWGVGEGGAGRGRRGAQGGEGVGRGRGGAAWGGGRCGGGGGSTAARVVGRVGVREVAGGGWRGESGGPAPSRRADSTPTSRSRARHEAAGPGRRCCDQIFGGGRRWSAPTAASKPRDPAASPSRGDFKSHSVPGHSQRSSASNLRVGLPGCGGGSRSCVGGEGRQGPRAASCSASAARRCRSSFTPPGHASMLQLVAHARPRVGGAIACVGAVYPAGSHVQGAPSQRRHEGSVVLDPNSPSAEISIAAAYVVVTETPRARGRAQRGAGGPITLGPCVVTPCGRRRPVRRRTARRSR
ncbi:hypothetical protein SANTM175S_00563 [Streptomyces antimycoticus]